MKKEEIMYLMKKGMTVNEIMKMEDKHDNEKKTPMQELARLIVAGLQDKKTDVKHEEKTHDSDKDFLTSLVAELKNQQTANSQGPAVGTKKSPEEEDYMELMNHLKQ